MAPPRDPLVGARGAALVLAAALAAHVASLRAGWVLDDWELLVENPYLRSAKGLGAVMTKELFVASGDPRHFPYYRPLSGLVYWLTYQAFGANGIAHHAFNAALHGVCAVLFFLLARRLRLSARTALVMGVLFAVHPVSAEVVAYAGGRQDVLGWTFTFGTMLLLCRRPGPPRTFAIAFTGTLLAALTRELFLAAPALHAVVAAHERRRDGATAAAGGAVAAGFVLLLRRMLDITRFDLDVAPSRLLGAAGAVLLRFVKVTIAPTDIAADVTIIPLGAGAGVAVLVLAGGVLAYGRRVVQRRVPDARATFLLGGVTFSVLVALHTPVALRFGLVSDRYAYGMVVAVLLLASPAIDALVARIADAKKTLFGAALAALAVALVPLTWARAADYTNDQTLTLAMVRDRPDDPRSLLARSVTLRAEGRNPEAWPLCRRHADVLPDDIVVNPCLAEEAIAAKDDARAVSLLETWLRQRPDDPSARVMYFQALFRSGDLARVKRELERFEALTPNAPDLRAVREALARPSAPPQE